MSSDKKFYTAKYDRVFKTVLCDEDDKELLQEFLSRILKKKVEIVEFLRNELPVNTTLEKVKTVGYNMDKIMDYWYNEDIQKVNEYKHLIMLDLETIELKKLSKGDDFVEKFEDKITKLNETETFQSAMTYEEDQRLILNTEKHISFNEGIEQGSKEKELEIAKSMLSEKLSLETISKCTNLTIEEINELIIE